MRPPAASVAALATAALLASTLACSAALRHPTEQDAHAAGAQWPHTAVVDLERGRTVYVRRCSGCHTLYLPSAYAPEDWPALVEAMSGKARLTPEQQADVTRFVVTLARDRR